MFNPGETIVHVFIIPFVANRISKVIVTYRNKDHNVFCVKEITSSNINSDPEDNRKSLVTAEFSQQESLLFEEQSCYKIQLNVITNTHDRFASTEITGRTGPQHIQEVIPV